MREAWPPSLRIDENGPGFYTGYGVKTLPGVREGLEEEGYGEAEAYVGVIAERLEAVTDALVRATALLR